MRGWRAAAPVPRTRPPRPWRSRTCKPRCARPRRRRTSRCTRSRAPATSAARRSPGPRSRARAACLLGTPGLMPVCRHVSVSHEGAVTLRSSRAVTVCHRSPTAPKSEWRCMMQVPACVGGVGHHRMWSTHPGRPAERLDWHRLRSAQPSSRRMRPRTRPTRRNLARAGARPGRRACARTPAGSPAGSARRTAPPRPACAARAWRQAEPSLRAELNKTGGIVRSHPRGAAAAHRAVCVQD